MGEEKKLVNVIDLHTILLKKQLFRYLAVLFKGILRFLLIKTYGAITIKKT